MTVEGVPNELYAQNMEYRHQYDEIVKHFAEGRLKEAGAIQKDLQLHNVNIALYYTDKYALWLDFRTIEDNRLHGLCISQFQAPTSPRADPQGNFLKWSKTLPQGKIFLQKQGPRDKKIPTPGSIVKDLVSFSCWSASKVWNFAEIKP